MTEVMVVLLIVMVVALVLSTRRSKSIERSEADESLRAVAKVADEDVTRFGEELQDLHIETLTTTIDPAMRQDYQRALDCYEHAKELLRDARAAEDVTEVTRTLEDGRYAMACVLARQAGEALPQRRPPCFFNAAHGPAQTDVEWAPPGGVSREIPVCLADADRLRHGAEPDTRVVRAGNRMVPWYDGGPAYQPYANGYYGAYALNGLFPGFVLGAMLSGSMFDTPAVDGTGGDAGGDAGGGDGDSGADGGGGDSSGDGGGDVGGGDPGGWGGDGGGELGGGWDLGGLDF